MKTLFPTCAFILLLSACASMRSPSAVLRDKNAGELSRIHAVADMPVGDTKALWRVVFDAGDAMSVRGPAARKLLAQDEAGFWKRIEADYKAVHDGPMLKWICEAARDGRALRALVLLNGQLRWGMTNEERPEPKAIERVMGGNAANIANDIKAGKKWAHDDAVQKAILFSLAREGYIHRPDLLVQPNEIYEIPDGSILAVLKKVHLCLLPMVEEEFEIVKTQAALPQLKNQTRVYPRGLPLARRNLLATSFTPLGPAVVRTKDAPLKVNGLPNPTDIAVCAEVLRGLRTPSVVASLFAGADADIDDSRSEHGGLLYWNDKNEVVFDAIAPAVKIHNQRYDPPESLFVRLRDGLAHVHFHAQKYDNAEYAGPGRGDLAFVENNRVNAVVCTFIDRDTLDVDAYFPGGVVVDLGCIMRQK